MYFTKIHSESYLQHFPEADTLDGFVFYVIFYQQPYYINIYTALLVYTHTHIQKMN